MGSSTNGKKHKKEKKHKRHRSHSVSDDEVVSRSSHHRHHHKHKKHKEGREKDRESKEHGRKHRHHHHHRHHDLDGEREQRGNLHEYEKSHSEVIDVQESDSDSSDCVEVPVAPSPTPKGSKKSIERPAPPPPILSKTIQRDTLEYSNSHRHPREEVVSYREDARYEREELHSRRDREEFRYEREEIPSRREPREDSRREVREDSRREVREIPDHSSSRYRDRPPTPPPPRVNRASPSPPRGTKRKFAQSGEERDLYDDGPSSSKSRRKRTPPSTERHSPIPENGAGDVLSIEETNKLRAKLGLKPLEVDPKPSKPAPSTAKDKSENESKKSSGEKDLSKYKDEWGEFLHKPADNLKEKAEAEKMREKLKQRKEKRYLEERLLHIKTLGESDEEVDDVSKWVQRSKRVVDEKKEAERRAKALEEMDAEFGVDDLVKKEQENARRSAYNDKHLRGLRVEHDIEDFSEGKTIILTLKDKEVLNEEDDDTLVNVNMIDNERYRKNVETKKQNPQSYGYNVYEEQYDELGNPIDRGVLAKYDEDLDGKSYKKKNFVIGENVEYQKEQKRKLLELQTKLAGKRLETLDDLNLEMASDTFSAAEMAKFKKPKKKVRKLRQQLKAEDLLPLNAEPTEQHLGSRNGRRHIDIDESESMDVDIKPDVNDIKVGEEEDDLERVLNKARKLKQKESLIKKPLPVDVESIKSEIKTEDPDTDPDYNIVLNATAEFCRTLGDIPTYGMSGNRNVGDNDRMDYEEDEQKEEQYGGLHQYKNDDEVETQHGTWNSVNPEDVLRPVDLDVGGVGNGEDVEDVAILDEEPDVGAGVANALRLALSKGYLEKEERKRPSNSKMSHLQAKNYSIEDKSAGDEEKIGRRDRFHAGPIMDFRDKDNFKPNVKLEYIDDNGRILNLKEAFRYLSHKFHGKGPGKNKIEKRLKKMEQDGLMKTMSSTDTPLGTLTMLQQKQKETKTPFVVLSGGKQTPGSTSISKYK